MAGGWGEFELIHRLRRRAGCDPRVVVGIGDDAAVVRPPSGRHLLLAADMLVEGGHFRRGTPARAVGRKALACNLSDIAAMGGTPRQALVSIGVPAGTPRRFVDDLFSGIFALAEEFGTRIVGGDTVRSRQLVVAVTLIGEAPPGGWVGRAGARPGDTICVTGPLGRSWKDGRDLRFVPRVKEARLLVRRGPPRAMIDISDGLAADLGHLLDAGGVGAVLHTGAIPLAVGARIEEALYDGEDYELIFTMDPRTADRIRRRPGGIGRLYPIGEVTDRRGELILEGPDGRRRRIPRRGFRHF